MTLVLLEDLSAIEIDSNLDTEITVNWTYEYVYDGVDSSQYYSVDTSRTFRFTVHDCDLPSMADNGFYITNDRHSDFIYEEDAGTNTKWIIVLGATLAWITHLL